jgi:hypothetical protein
MLDVVERAPARDHTSGAAPMRAIKQADWPGGRTE